MRFVLCDCVYLFPYASEQSEAIETDRRTARENEMRNMIKDICCMPMAENKDKAVTRLSTQLTFSAIPRHVGFLPFYWRPGVELLRMPLLLSIFLPLYDTTRVCAAEYGCCCGCCQCLRVGRSDCCVTSLPAARVDAQGTEWKDLVERVRFWICCTVDRTSKMKAPTLYSGFNKRSFVSFSSFNLDDGSMVLIITPTTPQLLPYNHANLTRNCLSIQY